MTDLDAALPLPRAARRGAVAAPRRAARRPSATRVVSGSLAVFLACFAFLGWQLRSGQDPSLGAPVAAATQPVLVKRIHRKVVVTEVLPAEADDAAVAASSGTSGSSSTQVVQSAPAAPAPAPTTRSS